MTDAQEIILGIAFGVLLAPFAYVLVLALVCPLFDAFFLFLKDRKD